MDIDARMSRIEERIQNARQDGSLSRREAKRAMNMLNDIRRDEQYRRQDGRLGDRDLESLQARLDRLSAQIHYDQQG